MCFFTSSNATALSGTTVTFDGDNEYVQSLLGTDDYFFIVFFRTSPRMPLKEYSARSPETLQRSER